MSKMSEEEEFYLFNISSVGP
uniref:S-cone pigment gene/opsin protein n=1 Tax=Aotus trivirgatus TaxID=9505 RepID=P79256_AOTTR